MLFKINQLKISFSNNNLIITPHIAGIINDYWDKQYQLFSQNLKNFKHLKSCKILLEAEIGY